MVEFELLDNIFGGTKNLNNSKCIVRWRFSVLSFLANIFIILHNHFYITSISRSKSKEYDYMFEITYANRHICSLGCVQMIEIDRKRLWHIRGKKKSLHRIPQIVFLFAYISTFLLFHLLLIFHVVSRPYRNFIGSDQIQSNMLYDKPINMRISDCVTRSCLLLPHAVINDTFVFDTGNLIHNILNRIWQNVKMRQ